MIQINKGFITNHDLKCPYILNMLLFLQRCKNNRLEKWFINTVICLTRSAKFPHGVISERTFHLALPKCCLFWHYRNVVCFLLWPASADDGSVHMKHPANYYLRMHCALHYFVNYPITVSCLFSITYRLPRINIIMCPPHDLNI